MIDFTKTPITELYGSNCFSNTVMRERLPKNIYREVVAVQEGEKELTLEVQVRPPVTGGELSYAWYDFDWQPGDDATPVSTDAVLRIPTEGMLPNRDELIMFELISSVFKIYNYCVVVTNTVTGLNGDVYTVQTKSNLVTVLVTSGFAGMFPFAASFVKTAYSYAGGGVIGGVSAIMMIPLALMFISMFSGVIGMVYFLSWLIRLLP